MRFSTVIVLLSRFSRAQEDNNHNLEEMYSIKTLPHSRDEITADPVSKSFIALGENPKFSARFGNKALYGSQNQGGNQNYPSMSITSTHQNTQHQGTQYSPTTNTGSGSSQVSQYGPSFGSPSQPSQIGFNF